MSTQAILTKNSEYHLILTTTKGSEKMSWFDGIVDLQELKKTFKKLAKKYHPDCGGDTELMKSINVEYDETVAFLKGEDENAELKAAWKNDFAEKAQEYEFTNEFWNSYEETSDAESDVWNIEFKIVPKNTLEFLIGLFVKTRIATEKYEVLIKNTETDWRNKKSELYRRGKLRRGTRWRRNHKLTGLSAE